jgi:hypothetical protein
MTQAQHALANIKNYMASLQSEDVPAHGRHIWEAVIKGAEGYDEEATAEADPSHTNEEAVFADGSRLWWNAALQAWETDPSADQMRMT